MRRRRSVLALLFVAGSLFSAIAPAAADPPTPFPLGTCVRVRLIDPDPICVYIDPNDDTTTAAARNRAR